MKPDSDTLDPMHQETEARKGWMGVLSRTDTDRLETAFAELGHSPTFEHLRPPEIGMAMVRARAEARGRQFNLGEMTVSRCSIRLGNGSVGHGYVAGRDKRHAELAAVFDALMQHPELGPAIYETVITPLACELAKKQEERAAKTEATKVNFFTMVRGEDQGVNMSDYAMDTNIQEPRDPAHDNQRIFRAILLTMSHPGTVTVLGNWPSPPKGLHPAAAAVCLALIDMDTPLWVSPGTPLDIQTYLRFHCGCPFTRKQENSVFGLILNGNALPGLDRFNPGEIEYPDRSATLIIQVASLDVGKGIRLSGPGINGDTQLHVAGLHPDFWQALQRNTQRFPLGFDVILTTETEIVSLPRTVQVGI